MTDHLIAELDRKGLRNFGLGFGAVVAALFGLLLPWLFSTGLPLWPWYLGACMALWSVAAPMTLRPFYRAWMKFGLLLHRVTTPVVLGVVFYGVITPTGLIARLFRSDPLQRDCKEARDSFRVASCPRPRDHMENPF